MPPPARRPATRPRLARSGRRASLGAEAVVNATDPDPKPSWLGGRDFWILVAIALALVVLLSLATRADAPHVYPVP